MNPITDFQSWLTCQPVTRRIDSILLHHSYRPTTSQYKGEETVEAIRRYHKSKGWRDIGYHLLVGPDGKIFPGRALHLRGAHALVQKPDMLRLFGSQGYINKHSIGICAIGDYDQETPSQLLLTSLKIILQALTQKFDIPADRIFFHRQFQAKTCPGKNFELAEVRSWLRPEDPIPAWALESWRWVRTKGLIFGEPDALVDRQALATVLHRYDKLRS